ncbi:MAG: CoA transferase [Actinobacteria bacterium]|nr:CoA transferase [Actinomycetota bacterium]
MTGPLEGVGVLDLSRLLPGGYATLLLADMGADVVKIEEPGKGDYIRWSPPMAGEFSASHVALNRNKRSMTLNLKSEDGRGVLLRLVAEADVLVESFRPGVMERLGVGYGLLRERNPRLVYAAISGYGQDGPRSHEAGHDQNYLAHAGALGIMGEESRRPTIPGLQIGDLAGGGMNAVIAVLAALYRRERTGTGDFCDVSMMDGIVSWLSIHAGAYNVTKADPERERMPLSGLYPCYRIYPAADGWLSVGALEPQFWAALVEAIDRPDLEGDAFAGGERRDEVIAELSDLFSTRTRAEWLQAFAGRDVCVAPVNGFGEALADRQVRHRDMAFEVELPDGGAWTHVGNPIRLTGAPGDARRLPPPGLGQHTDEILHAAGFDAGEIARLRQAGAV